MTPAAIVVGSLNMDLVMRVTRLPQAGETLSGHGFALAEGGKGANQAVASARLGARVAMVGRVGPDSFGTQLRASLLRDAIDATHVTISHDAPTGVAMIMVDDTGENRIILAPGANLALSAADIDAAAGPIGRARLLVAQLEVPVPAVTRAIAHAARAGAGVVLTPAPAAPLPADVWPRVDYLIPNETEASLLTGIAVQDMVSADRAARALLARGVRHVLLTMGAQGVFVLDGDGARVLPARDVSVVDTTAAGDCFAGGVVAGLCEGMTLDQAAHLGIEAASLCVTRAGAQPALPYRAELRARA
jgi:ribokinase